MRYRTRVTAPAAALTGTAAVLTAGTPAASAQTPALRGGGTPGAETLPEPDPVFPALGNDGYRVTAYHLDFSYDATNRLVDAIATLTLRATPDLSRFSLDALGLDIRSVRVGGRTAIFEQIDEKLRVTPACPLPERARVTVRIEYSADPSRSLAHTAGSSPPTDSRSAPSRTRRTPSSPATTTPRTRRPSASASPSRAVCAASRTAPWSAPRTWTATGPRTPTVRGTPWPRSWCRSRSVTTR